jgi:hypothetical protein
VQVVQPAHILQFLRIYSLQIIGVDMQVVTVLGHDKAKTFLGGRRQEMLRHEAVESQLLRAKAIS